MAKTDLIITPETRIGQMLAHYPELEKKLISISPTFKKLKNPILRKTIAKVATLRQVAKVGEIPIGELVNILRREVGQAAADLNEESQTETDQIPDWFDEALIVETIDARPMIEAGQQPVNRVFGTLNKLADREILKLITSFNPAPLIEMAAGKGFIYYQRKENQEAVYTYFKKKQ